MDVYPSLTHIVFIQHGRHREYYVCRCLKQNFVSSLALKGSSCAGLIGGNGKLFKSFCFQTTLCFCYLRVRLYIHRGEQEQNLDRRVHYVCTVAQNRPGPGEGFWLHIQVLLNQAVLIRKTVVEVKRDAASGGRRFHDSSKGGSQAKRDKESVKDGWSGQNKLWTFTQKPTVTFGWYISHISYIIFSQTNKFL